jgi:hypothetical protein
MAKSWLLWAAVVVLGVGLGGVLTGCSRDLGPTGPAGRSGSGNAPSADPDWPGAPDIADVSDGFACPPAGQRGEPLVVPLVCGQGLQLGTVSVTNDEKRLYVTFTPSDGWLLGHSRLAMATSLEAFPRPLRLRAGDMVYQRFHDRLREYTYSIPLRDGWLAGQQELFLAGTAMLLKPGPRWRPVAVRFVWADGQPFPRSGWQAYFTYTIQATGPGSCELTVGFPNLGVMFCMGQYAEILWTSDGNACGSDVRVELLHEGEVCQVLAESAPNTGVFVWEEVLQCGGAIDGYTVRVTDLGSGASDDSDEAFMIAECPED